MGNEAAKTRALWGSLENGILAGRGIDIGCGNTPVSPAVRRFDREDGDANHISRFVREQLDFVFSSHCLEHMEDPPDALREWWSIVRPGGHLILIVPDEDLYEQGYFPSLFNDDHKATFTISKERSWSPRSINLLDLVKSLDDAEVISIELQDRGYDRTLLFHATHSPALARTGRKILRRVRRLLKGIGLDGLWLFRLLRIPFDQTGGDALAQIQVIVRKRP